MIFFKKRFSFLLVFFVMVLFVSFALHAYANQLPAGNIEGFQSNTDILSGWAVDPDAPSQSLIVHVYLDQPYSNGGQLIGYLTANIPRPDVNSATGYSGDHGFQFTIPKQYEDGTTHTLFIYAIDSQGGVNPQLGGSPFQFKLNAPVVAVNKPIIGNVDGFKSNTDTLKGWVVDPNNPSQTLAVHIYLDQPYSNGGQLIGYPTASLARPDVNSTTGLAGDHGFEFTIPKQYEDGSSHTLYVYAINPNGGDNPLLTGSPFSFQINALGNGSISTQVNGSTLTLKTGAWVAGAITSLNYRGVEYIDSFDHGRELQSSAQLDNVGECYNPTEGGARDDGIGSTSTSILQAFNASGSAIISTNQMAFWLKPGETSPNCGNGENLAKNTTALSDYILNKEVDLGFQNLPNVIKYTASFVLPRSHSAAVFSPTVAYTPSSFSEFWNFDTKVQQASLFKLNGTIIEQGNVPIFTTPDHNSAIAVYSPVLPDQFNLGYGIGSFNATVTSGHPTNELECINREYNLTAKTYSYNCYVVVGTLNEVTNTLKSLVNYFHPAIPAPAPVPTPTPVMTPTTTPTIAPTTLSVPSDTITPLIRTYPYPSGSLVNENGTIYFISGHTKIPFTNWQAFIGLGYSWRNVITGDLSSYASANSYFITTANSSHPWGSWLVYKGTIYYSSEQGLIGVPTYQIFVNNGGILKNVVKANTHDITNIGNLPLLNIDDARIYN